MSYSLVGSIVVFASTILFLRLTTRKNELREQGTIQLRARETNLIQYMNVGIITFYCYRHFALVATLGYYNEYVSPQKCLIAISLVMLLEYLVILVSRTSFVRIGWLASINVLACILLMRFEGFGIIHETWLFIFTGRSEEHTSELQS